MNRSRLFAIAGQCVLLLNFAVGEAKAQAPTASQTLKDTRSVRGSGATGQLPKWTSTDTIGESIVSESNGNIGVGTTTPGSKLTVAGRIEASTTGSISAVLGQSQNGSGLRGHSDTGFGVFGTSTTGKGIQGLSDSGDGVFGFSITGNGVQGDTGNSSTAGVFGFNSGAGGNGVLGQAFNGTGVRGISSTSFGVFGSSETFTAVEARSNTGFGMFGSSNTNTGIYGQSNSGTGVFGVTNQGVGIIGQSPNGTGVLGISENNLNAGVSGFNSNGGIGITGQTSTGLGVFGSTNTGIAVFAQSTEGTAMLAIADSGSAGEFIGDVEVSGTLTKSGGSFKIDHPLDPANKTLSHSFVESPDMMNIYNGNIVTDENGEATILLPDYFEALNRDFRYQLTVIGQYAQAIVAEEVKNNRFRITTNTPGVKVSWQVTGIRRDAWAERNRIPVEQEKPEGERGFYLHPSLFGQDRDRGIEWARRPELLKRVQTMKETPPLEINRQGAIKP